MEHQPSVKEKSNYDFRNYLFAFIGLFTGLLFSIKSCQFDETANTLSKENNTLAKTALELSKNDTLQASQLNELKNLYKNAQKQLVAQEEQLKYVIKQLATIDNHYVLASSIAENSRLTNLYKLRKALNRVDELFPMTGLAQIKSLGQEDRIKFIQLSKAIVESELENPYLTGRPELLAKWVKMANSCDIAYRIIGRVTPENTVIVNEGGNRKSDDVDIRNLEDVQFGLFVDRFFDFYCFNLENFLGKESNLLQINQ